MKAFTLICLITFCLFLHTDTLAQNNVNIGFLHTKIQKGITLGYDLPLPRRKDIRFMLSYENLRKHSNNRSLDTYKLTICPKISFAFFSIPPKIFTSHIGPYTSIAYSKSRFFFQGYGFGEKSGAEFELGIFFNVAKINLFKKIFFLEISTAYGYKISNIGYVLLTSPPRTYYFSGSRSEKKYLIHLGLSYTIKS